MYNLDEEQDFCPGLGQGGKVEWIYAQERCSMKWVLKFYQIPRFFNQMAGTPFPWKEYFKDKQLHKYDKPAKLYPYLQINAWVLSREFLPDLKMIETLGPSSKGMPRSMHEAVLEDVLLEPIPHISRIDRGSPKRLVMDLI